MSAIHRLALLAGLAIPLGTLAGCAMQEPMANAWHDMKMRFISDGTDRRNLTEDVQEDWSFVGEEGRAGRPVQKRPDQWYRNYILSEKARQIESNLGVE